MTCLLPSITEAFSPHLPELGLNAFDKSLLSSAFDTIGKKPFEKILGKGHNTGNQHFLLFTQSFLPFHRTIAPFEPQ